MASGPPSAKLCPPCLKPLVMPLTTGARRLRFCANTDRYVSVWSFVNPFHRWSAIKAPGFTSRKKTRDSRGLDLIVNALCNKPNASTHQVLLSQAKCGDHRVAQVSSLRSKATICQSKTFLREKNYAKITLLTRLLLQYIFRSYLTDTRFKAILAYRFLIVIWHSHAQVKVCFRDVQRFANSPSAFYQAFEVRVGSGGIVVSERADRH